MMLRLGLALLVVMIAGSARAAPLYGDVNGNGVLDFRDAVILLRVAGGLRTDSDVIRRTGDVAPTLDYDRGSFGDGKITILDVLRVMRKASGLSTPAWPAKFTGYLLEAGNTFVLRRYDATGAVTGPDLDIPDITSTITGPVADKVGGVTINGVYVVKSDAGEQHLLPVIDSSNTPTALRATQLVFGGNTTTFYPPLALARYPFVNGAEWSGATTATDVASGTQFLASYTVDVEGPVVVMTADGSRALDNAWKVSLSYTTPPPGPTGTEYYWFVPFLGPVQHGYSRTMFGQTTTINPDSKLVSADLHGVLYP